MPTFKYKVSHLIALYRYNSLSIFIKTESVSGRSPPPLDEYFYSHT